MSNATAGRVAALSVSKKKGIPKTNVDHIRLLKDFGLEGDAHGGNWHRQVSLLALESVEAMRHKGLPDLGPGSFAENITTESVELNSLQVGQRLQIGAEALLEITQIGKDCHSRCAIFQHVGDCIMPREGLFARVIQGGEIRVGDTLLVMTDETLQEKDLI